MRSTILRLSILLTAILSSHGKASAQCGNAPCSNAIALPLPSDQNAFNNLNNQNGSRCFTNPTNTAQVIPNNFNYNGWSYLNFNAGTGTILSQQSINFNQNQRGYVSGNVTWNYVSMGGNADSANVYVAQNSSLHINTAVANNTNNYIFLAQNATVFIEGIQYFAGQFYQFGGNSTNRIYIVNCGAGTTLNTQISYFLLMNSTLYWKIYLNNNFVHVTLENSVDGKEWNNIYNITPNEDRLSEGSYLTNTDGMYRLNIDGYYSEIIYIKTKKVYNNSRISDIKGTLYNTEPINRIYYKDGKGHYIYN